MIRCVKMSIIIEFQKFFPGEGGSMENSPVGVVGDTLHALLVPKEEPDFEGWLDLE